MNAMFAYYSILFHLSKGDNVCVVSDSQETLTKITKHLEHELRRVNQEPLNDKLTYTIVGDRMDSTFGYLSFIESKDLETLGKDKL